MDKQPRIAVASSGLGHVARGIEAWANDLAEGLHARGWPVILCKGAGKVERPYERVLGCWQRESPRTKKLLKLFPKRLVWRLGLGSPYGIEQTTFAWNLIRELRRRRFDVLHVQDPLVALLVQRAHRIGLVRTKTILAHGTEEPLEFQKKITFLQHLAPWHLEEAKQAGVWKPTWAAIPNFIDTDRYSRGRADSLRAEFGIPGDALVVLSAAAIKRDHKRVDYVVREVARLRAERSDLPVWLVVAGGWESETNSVIDEGTRVLGDRVRFLVRFPRARMPELYRASDVFTLGSLKEMMPIALLEATASGLPCVVNRHPVMEWMVGAGGAAINMSQDGQLAEMLLELMRNSNRRQEMGRASRVHCLRNFAKDAVLNQILQYYALVNGRQTKPPTARVV